MTVFKYIDGQRYRLEFRKYKLAKDGTRIYPKTAKAFPFWIKDE